MNNKITAPITFDEIWTNQLRLNDFLLAQTIRIKKFAEEGIMVNESELLVGENLEIINSLQRKKDQHKKEIISILKKIRIEKERDKRTKEMNAQRHRKN